jgi:anti-sigma factor RsiW
VLNEIADSHVRSLIGNHLVDVASSDQHTVRPWFEGKVDFAPAVPDLSAHGFEIIGGRLDYINGHPAATLVYQCRKHYISLFIWPSGAANQAVQPARFESRPAQRGYQVLRWNSGGMSHWAISEINADELREFVEAFVHEEAGH